MTDWTRPTLTLSPERYAVLHKLINLGLDALPDDECTEDVLGAVAWFSATGALYDGYENYGSDGLPPACVR